jgi:predicted nucleic acid-binding protein
MKKTIFLVTIVTSMTVFGQKAKKIAFDFKYELLPTRSLSSDFQTFDYAIINPTLNTENKKKSVLEDLADLNGKDPNSTTQLLTETNYQMLKRAFNSLKYIDNKSVLGIPGLGFGSTAADGKKATIYKNVAEFTNKADLSIKIEFSQCDLISKEINPNGNMEYLLKLAPTNPKVTIINNKTNTILDEVNTIPKMSKFTFPADMNQKINLGYNNKLQLDEAYNNALNNGLGERIRQFAFDYLVLGTIYFLNTNYNFDTQKATVYFAYPKNDKFESYKKSVQALESTFDLITKNTKETNHKNWQVLEAKNKFSELIKTTEALLNESPEVKTKMEYSKEIEEGFMLNLVAAYAFTNDFANAEKYLSLLKKAESVYLNEAEDILRLTELTKENLEIYTSKYQW